MVNDLLKRWSHGFLQAETSCQNVLYLSVYYFLITKFLKARVSIYLKFQYIVFRFMWTSTVKWISFSDQVVENTAKAPDVNFLCELVVFQNEFRGRIVNVSGKIVSFEQLFKVKWHANHIKLYNLSLIITLVALLK